MSLNLIIHNTIRKSVEISKLPGFRGVVSFKKLGPLELSWEFELGDNPEITGNKS